MVERGDGEPPPIGADGWLVVPIRVLGVVEDTPILALRRTGAMEVEGVVAGVGEVAVVIEAATV